MKKILFISLLAISFLHANCTQTPNAHEQLFIETAESLNEYRNAPSVQNQLKSNEMVRDYMSLDFEAFKKKYKSDDVAMDAFARTMQTTVDIAMAFEAIRNNELKIEKTEGRKRADEEGQYSFEKKMPLVSDTKKDTNVERIIMNVK